MNIERTWTNTKTESFTSPSIDDLFDKTEEFRNKMHCHLIDTFAGMRVILDESLLPNEYRIVVGKALYDELIDRSRIYK